VQAQHRLEQRRVREREALLGVVGQAEPDQIGSGSV
jgi:hypothetical protein